MLFNRRRQIIVWLILFGALVGVFYLVYSRSIKKPIEEFLESEVSVLTESDHIPAKKVDQYKKYALLLNEKDYSHLQETALNPKKSDSARVLSVYLLGFAFHLKAIPFLENIVKAPFQEHPEDKTLDDIEVLVRSLALEGLSYFVRLGNLKAALEVLEKLESDLRHPDLLLVFYKALAYARGEVDEPVSSQERKELEVLLQKESEENDIKSE